MKKNNVMKAVGLGCSFFLGLSAVMAQSGYTIKGQLKKGAAYEKVYKVYKQGGQEQLDSTLVKHRKFSFKGSVDEPTLITLYLVRKDQFYAPRMQEAKRTAFYVDGGTTRIANGVSLEDFIVEGTAIQQEYLKYRASTADLDRQIDSLNRAYSQVSKSEGRNGEDLIRIRKAGMDASYQRIDQLARFVSENNGSYFSLIALQELVKANRDSEELLQLHSRLEAKIGESTKGEQVAKQIQVLHATRIGAQAPDFTQNDVNDKLVSLSDFRGQYVLLDFWASWCGPCRGENPHVVAAYEKFKNKNFTVLGVSLDQNGKKENWLKAIEEDKLTWTNVSDLKFWKNEAALLYGVRAVPQNFLIGPDGKILGKNLRGKELSAKLEQLLN